MFPRYVCHKEVTAALIVDIVKSECTNEKFLLVKGDLSDPLITVVRPSEPAMADKAQVGDYYVVYNNGSYSSVSPAKVFEEGYALQEVVRPKDYSKR